MLKWITLHKYCELSGYTENSIKIKANRGKIVEGVHYAIKDRKMHINPQEFDKWIESTHP